MARPPAQQQRRPVARFDCWTVEPDRNGGKGYWHKIGSAFRNADNSMTLRLFALPIDGVVIVRKPLPKREPGADDGSE